MSNCYHCHDTCETEIYFDDKVFCCEGCKTVYDILRGTNMETYYSLDENPGIKANKSFKGKFNFLDLDEFKSKLIFFQEGSIAKIRFYLPQIHCSSCLWLLERLHKLREGVIQSQVDFADKEAVITFDQEKISLRDLAELLASIGYPPSITLSDYDGKKSKHSNKQLIIQIGVAGFCFGNIMLLSFPEYLGINERDANFQQVFNYLNLMLSVPVLVFGAKDYIISSFKSVRAKAINIDVPITIGIFALYFRSLYEVLSGTGPGYFDSFAGLIFFLLIGKWFQQKTYSAINFERDYKSYFPIAVTRVKRGEEEIVALKNVKIGDRLRIRNNELIPSDAILMSGRGNIDYSFVTGESDLVSKREGEQVYAGGRQEGTSIEIEVVKEVENSYLTSLWNNPVFDKVKQTSLLSDRVSRYFTFIILLVALVGGIIWYTIDPSRVAFIITSVLIVACPCALALSVPFTYGNGIRVLGRKGFYLRSSRVIEPMTEITDLVFDKTGTLTFNNTSQIEWEGSDLSDAQKLTIRSITSHSSHPLSRKIFESIAGTTLVDLDEITEVSGKGLHARVGDEEWKIGSADWLGSQKADNRTSVFVSINGKVLGSFTFVNSYRKDLRELVSRLSGNYHLHVLSGDNNAEAHALESIIGKDVPLNFNQKPEDKLEYVKRLQDEGKKVMMLGDGLNDAGALRQSDIGVSVVDDVYSFSPASDGIIQGEKLCQLDHFLDYANYNKRVVLLSYVFSVAYNLTGLYFALSGQLTPLIAAILMPLSSISVVLLVTVLTNLKGRKF